ncbi:MAG: DUF58 domain-containing protein [Planctomycetota bacterium]
MAVPEPSAAGTAPERHAPLDPRVLGRVAGLRLRVARIVEGFITGMHQSPYHGFSIEFAQHRAYTPGDDLRYVDWKVFGKTDRFFIKEYEEETNLAATILMDASESMRYASGAMSKFDYGACIAASLAHILLHQQDAVSLVLFDDKVLAETPSTTGYGMLRNIVDVLEGAPLNGATKVDAVFARLLAGLRRRGVVIIVSDLFVAPAALEEALRAVAGRGHTVYLFHVIDRQEQAFDFDRPTLFRGLEGAGDLLVDPRAVRAAYRAAFGAFLDQVRRTAIRNRIHYHLMDTSLPLDVALSSVLVRHAGRRRA